MATWQWLINDAGRKTRVADRQREAAGEKLGASKRGGDSPVTFRHSLANTKSTQTRSLCRRNKLDRQSAAMPIQKPFHLRIVPPD